MKNLKKVLSLVLALAMTLSLMTVAFGSVNKASSMTSYDKTSYQEAMDVMVGLGVIDGVSGDLQPTANVTREQAAKIIAVLLEGTDAKTMYTTSQYFKDVSATRWSAPYIAYCVEKGIVSGVGNGNFNPTGNVTGYQFAKMLLVALGYDASIEGYTGTNWAVNVATDATSAKLFKGVTNANKTVAATREEVSQYALNLLKATMVTYDQTGTSITIGNTSVNVGASKASKVASDDTSINAKINKGDKFTDVNGVTGYSLEFGEKYFSADSSVKLAKTADNDRLMRPAHTWSIKDGDIGTYADSADQSYVLAKNGKSVATILTNSDYMDYDDDDVLDSAVIYINSVKQDTYKNDASITTLLGAGDVIETFTNDDDKVDTIVVTHYTAAKIDDVDNSLSSTYTKKDASYGITLTGIAGSTAPGNTLYDTYTGDSTKVLAGFNAKTYTKGTIIAIAMNGNEVLDSHVADAMAGSAIGSYNSTSIYIDGVKYTYAMNVALNGASASSATYSNSTKYDVYTDKNGYVIAVSGVSTTIKDVYYVTGIYGASSSFGGTSYYAQAVNVTTGEVKEMQLENLVAYGVSNQLTYKTTANGSTGLGTADANTFVAVNGLYTFTDKECYTGASSTGTKMKADNDKYNATLFIGNADYQYIKVVDADTNDTTYALSAEVKTSSSSIKTTAYAAGDINSYVYNNNASPDGQGAAATKYINSKTIFTSVEGVKGDISVSAATGSTSMAQGDPDSVFVIYDPDTPTKAAYVVFAGSDLGGAVGSDKIVYFDDTQTVTKNTSASTQNASLWFMDGMSKNSVVVDTTGSFSGFYTYKTTSDDVYKLSSKSDISGAVGSSTDGVDAGLSVASYDSDINALTATNFDAIRYGSATVIDVRSSAAKDADVYTDSITSVNALNNAMKKCTANGTTSGVVLDVHVEDGAIDFIAVQEIADAAGLTNAAAPTFSVQPQPATYATNAGTVAPLTVTAAGSGTLSYQWYKNGVVISGATGASYTPDITTAGAFTYYCAVTNTDNSVSGTKTATANSSSAIITVTAASYTISANISGTHSDAVTCAPVSALANTTASVVITKNTAVASSATVTVTNAATGASYGTYVISGASQTISVPVATGDIVLNIACDTIVTP